jgi:hypothetical protein
MCVVDRLRTTAHVVLGAMQSRAVFIYFLTYCVTNSKGGVLGFVKLG